MHFSNIKIWQFSSLLAVIFILSMPAFADGVSGSAAGGSTQGSDSQLETCTETLGTLAVHEDHMNLGGILTIDVIPH